MSYHSFIASDEPLMEVGQPKVMTVQEAVAAGLMEMPYSFGPEQTVLVYEQERQLEITRDENAEHLRAYTNHPFIYDYDMSFYPSDDEFTKLYHYFQANIAPGQVVELWRIRLWIDESDDTVSFVRCRLAELTISHLEQLYRPNQSLCLVVEA